ncbi:MupA/Atu3671 family FMN-dependent luciferase-like monooxygenase [Streptomyces sp. CC219B]|uniref:MupA/Atu3671 family FMN-dependent luciferase-like monooxygenase n=1 Tax=Streptomyces sp. CC219B TaxID=3044574 RepID=UPI0024A9E90E|nr:MupA/Atu3671 family FMN-dependent luciferase-like monooxygenase [Streptomyces sp. CC219B]
MTVTAGEVLGFVSDRLTVAAGRLDPGRSFVAAGADSLSLMALARAVRSEYGVTVSVRELFTDADTPGKLAELVSARAAERPAATAASRPAPCLAADPGPAPAVTAPAAAPVPPSPTPSAAPAEASPVTPTDASPGRPARIPPAGAYESALALFTEQLDLAGTMLTRFSELTAEQLRTLGALRGGPVADRPADAPAAAPETVSAPVRPSPAPRTDPAGEAPVAVRPAASAQRTAVSRPASPQPASPSSHTPPRPAPRPSPDFSLYFFGDYPGPDTAAAYRHLLQAAQYADDKGFHAVWLPERHFHSFGALFPSPSVLASALATQTSRIRLHAGSVVLPLHHPVRVAEEWAVVDNLSGGRVGLGFASGWHATDFVLAPENYGRQRDVLYDHLETFRRLWSGDAITLGSGDGRPVEVSLHPRPVQGDDVPLFAAVLSNPESYARAARAGLGVVTNLMAQSVEDLAQNIARYRAARAAHGLDPAAGRVVVLVHTYLGPDGARARQEARKPFCDYLRSSIDLFDNAANSLGIDVDLRTTDPDDLDYVLDLAYERYCATRALIGSADDVRPVLDALTAAGADEIGCFVDFGVAPELMLGGLPELDRLRVAAAAPRTDTVSGPAEGLPVPAGTPPADAASAPAGASVFTAPATPLQRRMWLLDRMHPGSHTYYEPKALLIEGPLDTDALRAALRRVVQRHPQLRTVFRETSGRLEQVVLDTVDVDCPVTDLSGLDDETALLRLRDLEDEADFDLAAGPLLRARIGRLAEERHLLHLVAHHIVLDALSTRILCRDLAAYYRAHPGDSAGLPELPRLPVAAQESGTADGLAYWKRELADAVPLDLPIDRPRSAGHTVRGATLVHEVGGELRDAVHGAARAAGCTPFMALLGAVAAVLGRFAAQDDVVIGTAVSNRPDGAEDAVGMFVGTVPLRLDLSGGIGFTELLHRVKARTAAAMDHKDVPFDEIVQAVNPDRGSGAHPLSPVMVEYEEDQGPVFAGTGLSARFLDVPRAQAPFPLTFYFTDHTAGVRCTVEYDAALFETSTVRRIVEYVELLLRGAVGSPGTALSALPPLTARDERDLARFQGERTENEPATLHGLFEVQAARTPDALAVAGVGDPLTYAELDAAANRLARRLAARGLERGEVAAVCVPRGPGLVTAVLAVLKCGAAYVPVDRALPAERRAFMLADSGARLVVADREAEGDTAGELPCPVQWLDDVPAGGDDGPLGREVDPEDTAYLIYTSGSTGRPKPVAVPHRGPANLVRWQLRTLGALRTVQWASAGFDVSVQEIFSTLASGQALITIDDQTRYDPAAVAERLRAYEVQRMSVPYTPLKYLARELRSVPSLRQLLIGGEKLTLTPELRDLAERCPDLTLYNHYGPTETSVVVTSHRVDPATETVVPIGRPVDNVQLAVADAADRPVPIGVPGQLLIGGVAVSHGYHGNPDATERGFFRAPGAGGGRWYRSGDLVRWRADGVLEYLGRMDDQVKIRGYRVEPEEAQWALGRLDGVREAVVLARPDESGDMELAAFVVLSATPAADADWSAPLRARLAAMLPHYLVPQSWVRLDRIPYGPTGKLARDRLLTLRAEPAPATADFALSELERTVHKLWAVELGVDPIDPDRSFFDVGGNSLSAVRLLERLYTELGHRLPVSDFFAAPTIRGVAARLTDLRDKEYGA